MKFKTLLACVVLVLAGVVGRADDLTDLRSLDKSVRSAVAKAEPAVACVLVNRRAGSSGETMTPPDYFGSGVVIGRGLVLTCYHVVRDAKSITIRLPALAKGETRTSGARIYAADNRSDLAVLQIEERRLETPAVTIGLGEGLKKGSLVLGLSHPYANGFRAPGPSVSWGMVANLRQRLNQQSTDVERPRQLHQFPALIKLDDRMQVGCSGGAILDLDGKLVGLVTAQAVLAGGDGLGGYAIPIDEGVRRIIRVLSKGEEVEYGFLGVMSGGFGRSASSVTVNGVTPGSPAARAGLRLNDVIVRINGQSIRTFDDMLLHIGQGLAGVPTKIEVLRQPGRELVTLTAILAKAENPDFGEAVNRPTPIRGLRVDYASVLALQADHPIFDAVVVREVAADSPAAAAKLTPFADVITEVNGVAVPNPAAFYREAGQAVQANRPVTLTLTNPIRTVVLP